MSEDHDQTDPTVEKPAAECEYCGEHVAAGEGKVLIMPTPGLRFCNSDHADAYITQNYI